MSTEEGAAMDAQDKPRRLEDETAQYLSEVEVQLNAMSKDDEEGRSVLVQNVLTEISTRSASAACDRRTNYLVEQLVAQADAPLCLSIVEKWTPYVLFLARNRFASHAVQTLLARMSLFMKQNVLSTASGSDEWIQTSIDFARPLIQEMQWLGKEMSASHVLRSLICFLAGLPPIAEKKGKKSKHQHSVLLAEPLENLLQAGTYHFSLQRTFAVPEAFHEELLNGVKTLLKKSKRDVQLLIADFSACAMLSLLLRVLCTPGLFPQHSLRAPRLAQDLFAHALELPSAQRQKEKEDDEGMQEVRQEDESPVLYAMAGDKAGSYFLETLCEIAPVRFLLSLARVNILVAVKDFALDGFGNFVVQALTKRFCMECEQRPNSEVQDCARELLDGMFAASTGEDEEEKENTINFALQLLKHNKGGVLNWMLQLTSVVQPQASTHAHLLAQSLLHYWQRCGQAGTEVLAEDDWQAIEVESEVDVSVIAAYVSQRLSAAPKHDSNPDVGNKKGANNNNNSNNNESTAARSTEFAHSADSQQLLVARLLGTLLRCGGSVSTGAQSQDDSHRSPISDIQRLAAKIVTSLSSTALQAIATSGPMSKAILDVFFEQFAHAQELKMIGLQLVTIGSSLAMHFVGQHVVRRVYQQSDLRGREKWAQLFANDRLLLQRTKEGRGILTLVDVELFVRDATEWRANVKKQIKATTLMSELGNPESATQNATSETKKIKNKKQKPSDDMPSTAEQPSQQQQQSGQKKGDDQEANDDDDEDNDNNEDADNNAAKKRKRKRKRTANANAQSAQ